MGSEAEIPVAREAAHLTSTVTGRVLIGTAGWSVPSAMAGQFETTGTHLERYARRLHCAEINSSFYRPHRQSTYAKWAAMVPENFRFTVKLPKTITHGTSLAGDPKLLQDFLAQVSGLGIKLAALLVQLPPRRAFLPGSASDFFRSLRDQHPTGIVALEPRHPSWFCEEADALLRTFSIARVGADPAVVPTAAIPGGDPRTRYIRLHGSPHMYYSAYPDGFLRDLAQTLQHGPPDAHTFVLFDNTAAGEALRNALTLQTLVVEQ